MNKNFKTGEDRMKKTIKNLEDEFNNLRSGRGSVSLFDKIKVNYYGNPTPLNQVANISTPEARLSGYPTLGQESYRGYRKGDSKI